MGRNGAHASRTMMLEEIQTLLDALPANATKADYVAGVVDANLLGKGTAKARELTAKHLVELYGLDENLCLFRVFRRLWQQDAPAQPVLALTLALARDPLLRLSRPLMLAKRPGEPLDRREVEDVLDQAEPGRFSAASLKSFAQNINGSWTQAGFLHGRARKVRALPAVTPTNLAFDDPLKARLLKLIYLIGKLPTEAVADTGVRATGDTLADLLMVDLPAGSADLRKRIPDLLHDLQEKAGLVMGITTPHGVEDRLQTRESSAWQDEYRHQESELKSSVTRIEQERSDLFRKQAWDSLRQVRLSQGKEARDLSASFDAELPKDHAERVVASIQDGWQADEKSFLAEARAVGNSDPSLFVYLPARNKTDLANAIVAMKAAKATLDSKGVPSTPEGEEALSAMTTRLKAAEHQIQTLLGEVFAGARVFQAGGTEVTDPDNLAGKLTAAGQKSVIRLYPQFDVADQTGWEKVLDRARKNDSQALEAVGYKGDPDKHPVCAAILKFIAGGKKGSDIRDNFRAPPFGWPQDAVDGALYALLASGHRRALDAAHKAVDAKGLERSKLTQASFKPESVTVSPVQLIQLRKLMQEVGITCQPQEELQKAMLLLEELKSRAAKAGGESPKPAVPDVTHLNQLEQLAGNALLVQLHADRDKLLADANAWQQAGQTIDKRWPNWIQLTDLLNQARDLGPHAELAGETKAIADQRALLSTPDPVQALLEKTMDLLRRSLNHHVQAFQDEYTARLSALQADESWQKLGAADQTTLLKEGGLEPAQVPDMSSAAALEQALDDCPLARWADKREALANRFDQARQKAVKKVSPKAMPVQLPHRVLSSQDELKAWLDEVEKLLKERLGQGPVSL